LLTGIPECRAGSLSSKRASDPEAQAAIAELNGKTIDGQVIKVNEARPKSGSSKGYIGKRQHREHRY
jgi:hypothetical protein